MNLFPMFLKLAGRCCLVVGAGSVGEGKIESLLRTGAMTAVVAPRATERVEEWNSVGRLRWCRRAFWPHDLDNVFMVVAATSSASVNARVYREARRRGVLCNVVDDPDRCDFYYPAVVRRGPLQIAISTSGRSPALAQRLRRDIEQQIDAAYEPWLETLAYARRLLMARVMDPAERRKHLHSMVSRQAFTKFKHRSRSRSA